MSKPIIVLCKPKSAVCKLFCAICKPINLSNSEFFCKIQLIRGLFLHAYHVPRISGSIRQSHFLGSKKVNSVYHSFHGFAPRCLVFRTCPHHRGSFSQRWLRVQLLVVPPLWDGLSHFMEPSQLRLPHHTSLPCCNCIFACSASSFDLPWLLPSRFSSHVAIGSE